MPKGKATERQAGAALAAAPQKGAAESRQTENMAKPGKGSLDTSIRLTADLRIAQAAATYGALRDAAASASPRVVLDARQVEKADAAGLQALLAGRMAVQNAGKAVSWSGCTPALRDAAGLLGLADALELP